MSTLIGGLAARPGPEDFGEPWQSIFAWFLVLVGLGLFVLMVIRFRTFWGSRSDFQPAPIIRGAGLRALSDGAMGRVVHLLALVMLCVGVFAFTEEVFAAQPWTDADGSGDAEIGTLAGKVAFGAIFVILVPAITIVLFNRPKWLVPPARRAEPGLLVAAASRATTPMRRVTTSPNGQRHPWSVRARRNYRRLRRRPRL